MLRHSYFETLVREPVSREADVYRLLTSFEVAVSNGEPLSFATFKDLWQARHFSLIFEVWACRYCIPARLACMATIVLQGQ
jgi:hypothetical protein